VSAALAMLRHDIRLQARSRVPAAAVVVFAVWITALAPLPTAAMPAVMPVVLFVDVAIFGFLLLAGLVFFERDERVLDAIAVSPLPAWAYVASKTAALSLVAVVLSLALVVVRMGPAAPVSWPLVATGATLTSFVVCLAGLAFAVRFRNIFELLMPSVAFLAVLQLPLLQTVKLAESPWFWVFPTQGVLVLLEQAFGVDIGAGSAPLALVHAGLWTAALFGIAVASFERFVRRGREPGGSRPRSTRDVPASGTAGGGSTAHVSRTLPRPWTPAFALVRADVASIRREPVLLFLVAYPWVGILILRWFLPRMDAVLRPGFALADYYGLVTSIFALLTVPVLLGAVIGFLLLDERDEGALAAVRVAPISPSLYGAARTAVPMAMSLAFAFAVVAGLGFVRVPAAGLLAAALLAATEAPIVALLMASVARNKVEGLALAKGIGFLFLAPVIAWFAPAPWQWAAGVLPMFWPVKAFWMVAEGAGPWHVAAVLLAGALVHAAYFAAFARRFARQV